MQGDLANPFLVVVHHIGQRIHAFKLGLQDELRLGNLEAQRDWGHAKDYVRGMWLMLQHETPDDYVLATGKTVSVRDFLELVFERAGLNADDYVVIDERFYRPCEVPKLWGDPSKAMEVLGWKPEYDFKSLAYEMYDSDLLKEQD